MCICSDGSGGKSEKRTRKVSEPVKVGYICFWMILSMEQRLTKCLLERNSNKIEKGKASEKKREAKSLKRKKNSSDR